MAAKKPTKAATTVDAPGTDLQGRSAPPSVAI